MGPNPTRELTVANSRNLYQEKKLVDLKTFTPDFEIFSFETRIAYVISNSQCGAGTGTAVGPPPSGWEPFSSGFWVSLCFIVL